MSICDFGGSDTSIPEDGKFEIFVYNPLGKFVSPYINFFVPGSGYRVFQETLEPTELEVQSLEIPEPVKNLPGRTAFKNYDYEIVFHPEDIPPLSQVKFSVEKTTQFGAKNFEKMPRILEDDTVFVTERGSFHYSHDEKSLKSFVNTQGVVFNFTQEFMYYIGHRGDNSEFEYRASGAYIFRPLNQEPTKLNKAWVSNLPFYPKFSETG